MSLYSKFPAAGGNKYLKFEEGVPMKLKLVNIETKEGDPTKPEFCDDKGNFVEFEFLAEDGSQKLFSRKSLAGFGYQLQKTEVDENDWVEITRTGSGDETRYAMTKVEAPAVEPVPSSAEVPATPKVEEPF